MLVYSLVDLGPAFLQLSVQLILPSKSISTKMARKGLFSSVFCHVSCEILGIFCGEEAAHKGALMNLPAARVRIVTQVRGVSHLGQLRH